MNGKMEIWKIVFVLVAMLTLYSLYIDCLYIQLKYYKTKESKEEVTNLSEQKELNLRETLHEKLEIIKNKNCSSDILHYLQEIENLTPWAIKMFDATAKVPSGILEGNLRHFGNFDECLDVKVLSSAKRDNKNAQTEKYHEFYGLYCMVTVNIDAKNSSKNDPYTNLFQQRLDSLLETMMLSRRNLEDREKKRDAKEFMPVIPIFTLSQWAVCLPSTCKAKDLEVYLNEVLSAITHQIWSFDVSVRVEEEACFSNPTGESSLSVLFKEGNAVLYTIAIVIFLVFFGTLYDLARKRPKKEGEPVLARILSSFSIPANLNKILAQRTLVKPASQSSNLDCVDGVRALSAIWVIITHKVLLFTQEPLFNKIFLKESIASLFWMPLTGNSMSVDSFLLIGGLLRSYNYTRDLDQGKSNQILTLIQRYLRLTPAFGAVIWFYALVLPHLFDGPEWDWFVTSASEDCKEDWLLNLFYVHNYFGFPRLCLFQSWYLAADMQLYILAPLFIYPLWRAFTKFKGYLRYLGALPLVLAVLACMVAQFIITYKHGFPALFRVGSEDHILKKYVQHLHMTTHTRMAPYLIGLIIGFILNKHRGKNILLSKYKVYLGWILTITTFLYVLYGPYKALQLGTPINPLPDSIFAGIHRTLWGMALGWLVFACCTGYGGVINSILSSKLLHHLSNISYCVFLTHVAILLTSLGGNRTSAYKDQYRFIRDFIADIVLTIIASTILYTFIEAPFSTISQIIFKKDRSTGKESPLTENKEKNE